MRRIKFFDDLLSWLHFIGGFIFGLSIYLAYLVHWVWFILYILYISFVVYEAVTSKSLDEAIGDISEFNIGLVLGSLIVLGFILGWW